MTDDGTPVHQIDTVAKLGQVAATFPLEGTGPHTIEVQMMNEPSKTATVPIIGSRREQRQQTVFSQLGALVTGSLLPDLPV